MERPNGRRPGRVLRLAFALAGLLACGGSATLTPAVERVQEVAAPTSSPAPTQTRDPGLPVMWDCPDYDSMGDALYVASREREVFHVVICRWAEEIAAENRVCFATREAAVAAGYRPCEVCEP